jgi:hypothetical protein
VLADAGSIPAASTKSNKNGTHKVPFLFPESMSLAISRLNNNGGK